MTIVVEDRKAVNELPNRNVVGMKYVWPIPVDVDALGPLGIAISADMRATIDEQHAAPRFGSVPRKDAAKESSADHNVVYAHQVSRSGHGRHFFGKSPLPASHSGTDFR